MQKLDLLTRNRYKLHQVSRTRLHLGADIFSTTISILPLRLQIKMAIVILTDFSKFRGIESRSIAAQYPVAAKCKARYSEWLSEEL
jgi:hypothetical protein